jgi:hypothetical protein
MEIEQSQAGFIIVYFDQRYGPGQEKEFESRMDIGFQHVPAAGLSGRESHHPVNVNRRLTGKNSDVAKHGAGFDLTVDRNVAKLLAILIV